MKLNPPKGMRDILIRETEYRSFVLNEIVNHYKRAGFFEIITPLIEDAENISKSDGGENLSLVFEIMKRGEKLAQALEKKDSLSDLALRYDLTLPLSRFYSANKDELPFPFKVIQTGPVFRAERPQKGRLREFVQCDIDIIGDDSSDAEIEILHTSLETLYDLGFRNLTLNVNDRRILHSILLSMGFGEDDLQSVCITFDKCDKIGIDGVRGELLAKSFDCKSVERLCEFVSKTPSTIEGISPYVDDGDALVSVERIFSILSGRLPQTFSMVFAPNLVRGQGYYTGTVAEVTSPDFSGAIAGGGRYDNLVGKFTGKKVPAVGFSIGFERIMGILLEKGGGCESACGKVALCYDSDDDYGAVLDRKSELVSGGETVSLFKDVKNKRKFYSALSGLSFTKVIVFGSDEVKELR